MDAIRVKVYDAMAEREGERLTQNGENSDNVAVKDEGEADDTAANRDEDLTVEEETPEKAEDDDQSSTEEKDEQKTVKQEDGAEIPEESKEAEGDFPSLSATG